MPVELIGPAREAAEKAIRDNAHLLGRPGFVAQASGGEVRVVPWQQSSVVGYGQMVPRDPNMPVPEAVVQQLRSTLPAIRRRTPAERLKAMTDTLIDDATRAYERTGSPIIADSVAEDVCRVLAMEYGRFISVESVKRMTLDEIRRHLVSKAKRDFIAAGHEQEANDARKPVLDWHGHYNHKLN